MHLFILEQISDNFTSWKSKKKEENSGISAMLCGSSKEKDKNKSKKNKPKEIKVFVDKELDELKLGKDNKTKLIKALLGATMHTQQYDIS